MDTTYMSKKTLHLFTCNRSTSVFKHSSPWIHIIWRFHVITIFTVWLGFYSTRDLIHCVCQSSGSVPAALDREWERAAVLWIPTVSTLTVLYLQQNLTVLHKFQELHPFIPALCDQNTIHTCKNICVRRRAADQLSTVCHLSRPGSSSVMFTERMFLMIIDFFFYYWKQRAQWPMKASSV